MRRSCRGVVVIKAPSSDCGGVRVHDSRCATSTCGSGAVETVEGVLIEDRMLAREVEARIQTRFRDLMTLHVFTKRQLLRKSQQTQPL